MVLSEYLGEFSKRFETLEKSAVPETVHLRRRTPREVHRIILPGFIFIPSVLYWPQ